MSWIAAVLPRGFEKRQSQVRASAEDVQSKNRARTWRLETWRLGDLEICRLGDLETVRVQKMFGICVQSFWTWRLGDLETWKLYLDQPILR